MYCFECKNLIKEPQLFYWDNWYQSYNQYGGHLPNLPPLARTVAWFDDYFFQWTEDDVDEHRIFCHSGCEGAYTGEVFIDGSDAE